MPPEEYIPEEIDDLPQSQEYLMGKPSKAKENQIKVKEQD